MQLRAKGPSRLGRSILGSSSLGRTISAKMPITRWLNEVGRALLACAFLAQIAQAGCRSATGAAGRGKTGRSIPRHEPACPHLPPTPEELAFSKPDNLCAYMCTDIVGVLASLASPGAQ
ncbi:unnamed protein product [Prorocentrum cordatum]|uniref:Uncharacterized protein n=1 Tax=Prorocentrum cordatum TaxID=2364126 RepID=A0ABN9TMT6_9DINO|nr:unnamed protein product [Polarella glacialis]